MYCITDSKHDWDEVPRDSGCIELAFILGHFEFYRNILKRNPILLRAEKDLSYETKLECWWVSDVYFINDIAHDNQNIFSGVKHRENKTPLIMFQNKIQLLSKWMVVSHGKSELLFVNGVSKWFKF